MPTRRKLKTFLLLAAGAIAMTGCQFDPFRMMSDRSRQKAIDRYVAGQMQAEKGDLYAALRELAAAVRADPDLSIAYAAMGDIHRRRGDWPLAQHAYEESCRANPYSFRPHYNLGVVYQHLSSVAKTVEKAHKYLQDAVAVYLRAVTLEPDDYDANLNLSACYFSLGKQDLAEKYCKAAIALEPKNPEAYSNLGVIYDSQDRLYEAIKAYKDSLELNVHQPRLLINLGTTYMRQGRTGPALLAFKSATQEDPNSSEAWAQFGNCHYHRKEYSEAAEAYQTALTRDDANADAHRGLGVVYMTEYLLDTQKADLRDKALAAWHRSLELQPGQQDIIKLVQKYAPKATGPDL